MVVWLVLEHFGRHILERPAEGFAAFFLLFHVHTPSEITYLQQILFTDYHIFWFYVPVDEAILLQEINTTTRLDKEVESLVFVE